MERYEEIIPNYNDFLETKNEPQPNEIRINNIKSNKKEITAFLDNNDIKYSFREQNQKFIVLERDVNNSLPHWLGLFYVQEFSSGIPPIALDISKEDKILDMCAAPGSKTTQIADILDNEGKIVANEPVTNRLRALMGNIYRLGVLNTQVIQYDGQTIPENQEFDKVLVDAPCSGEGNLRKEKGRDAATEHEMKSLSKIQNQLLNKAISLVKDEGLIVYSTCTFAPEENEEVVDNQLSKKVELIDPEFDFAHSNGLTRWKNKTYSSELRKTARIYPHQLDTGGIFVAKLKKKS